MKQHKRRAASVMGLAMSCGLAMAGEKAPIVEPPPVAACNLCDLLRAPGQPLYENPDNWLIQSFNFMGRAQFQYAYIDGDDVNGDGFSETYDEIRRLRFGAEARVLKYLKLKGNANFVLDLTPAGGDRNFEYVTFDELYASFDMKEAFNIGGLDKLALTYGRQKVKMGQEVHTSSKQIKTVERSPIANRIYPTRMTGALVSAAKGIWSGAAAVYTTDFSRDIANWEGGEAFYLNSNFELTDSDELILDFLWNTANGDDEDNLTATNVGTVLYEWAASAAWVADRGRWGLVVNAMVGDNGENLDDDPDREGLFYGIVVMPTYQLVGDRIEAVARYTWQGAEESEGIRTNSRYFRREETHDGDVNSGRGDSHHSIYGGMNFYLCEDYQKIMTGLEWETLDTPDGDADAWTLWLAYRMFF